jgi:release factor glutamine methyltransferase
VKIKEFMKQKNGVYILEKVLNKDKAWLFLNDEIEVPKKALEILKRVNEGYPVEYLFEEVWFFGDKFYIKEGVLIPRDDTEVVVERAIGLIKEKQLQPAEMKNGCKVVDCCTGSGVIAIEIAKHTNAEVIATDISDIAVEVAKKNVQMHKVEVDVRKCDLLCGIRADILISNPPYVENSWQKPNKYEPDLAFFGGEDGLDIVKKLILNAIDLGYKAAVIEIGYNQKELLNSFLKERVKSFEFFKDLAGNIRGVEILF